MGCCTSQYKNEAPPMKVASLMDDNIDEDLFEAQEAVPNKLMP